MVTLIMRRITSGVGGIFVHLLFIWYLPSAVSLPPLRGSGADVRFTIKVKEAATEAVIQGLLYTNFQLLFEITPTTYIVEYMGDRNNDAQTALASLLRVYKDQILAAEPVRGFWDTLKPAADDLLQDGSTSLLADSRRFIIKVRKHYKAELYFELRKYRYFWLYEITPETSVFEYKGHLGESEVELLTLHIRRLYKYKIVCMEKVIVYENTLKPEAAVPSYTSRQESSYEIDNNYGMGVSNAHKLGYTGNGVVVAITDVGINTDLLDLKENIDRGLCYNFINNSRNVTPEYFHSLQDKSSSYTAHGDHCASIIGSVLGNGECTFGISFKATIVGLKIFMVRLYNDRFFDLVYSTRSDIVSRALVHNLSKIDIFSNSWGPTKPFTALDLPTKDAIRYGAEKGRRGLGTIYVVPAGPTGNELANNIYTIAVNGVGKNWSVPADSSVSAGVITCGLSGGSNITANYMVTASQRNRCVTSFRGVSASTAQVAAISALGLEGNPRLTRRQLMHLLVQASDPSETGQGFSSNAAGHRFHMVFGYGLLNAERLVLLAKRSRKLPRLLKRSFKEASMRNVGLSEQEAEFCYSCDRNNDVTCLDTLEHVVVKLRLTNYCEHLGMVLVSPMGTESVLISFGSPLTSVRNKKIQLTSVHFWDEVAFGTWRLKLSFSSDSCSDLTNMQHVSFAMYGTQTWTPEQYKTKLEQVVCVAPLDNVLATESVTITPESKVSVTIHIDLSNLVVVIIGLVILGTIILVAGRLPKQMHFLRKY